MVNELESYAFKRMNFSATMSNRKKNGKSLTLTDLKVYNIVPTGENICSKEVDKFEGIPKGSIVKFSGIIYPCIKIVKSKPIVKYNIFDININEVEKLEIHTRKELKEYKDKYVMCKGIVSKKAIKRHRNEDLNNKKEKMLCISNVKINGNIELDHIWIEESEKLKGLSKGSTLSFVGKVTSYCKFGRNLKGKLNKSMTKDYKIININNIEIRA